MTETNPPHSETGRLIGLDLGRRRIGVAVSDADRTVATGVCALERRAAGGSADPAGQRAEDHAAVAGLVAEYGAAGVVVGIPYSLSGAVGPAAAAALDEVRELSAVLRVPIRTMDERLTTVTASSALRGGGRSARRQRAVIDQTAAAVILQAWIDGERSRRRRS
jgi:putative Holliday junction resolvase